MLSRVGQLGPHVLCGDFNVFQKADCSPEQVLNPRRLRPRPISDVARRLRTQWAAILADATSKGWPAPPETTLALRALQVKCAVTARMRASRTTVESPARAFSIVFVRDAARLGLSRAWDGA